MITFRTAKQCGHADYGWLQARYTFSFGHYFDPSMLSYASLRVLNQEVMAPGASFQPRACPPVDMLNLLLQGQAEYRDSEGNHIQASADEALILSAQTGVTYSEHNIGSTPLTRMQLWLDACPDRENPPVQRLALGQRRHVLLASPDGENGSMRLRQQAWVHHFRLDAGERLSAPLVGPRAYLQSIHGSAQFDDGETMTCGDGAFLQQERTLTLQAQTPLRALLIDLAG